MNGSVIIRIKLCMENAFYEEGLVYSASHVLLVLPPSADITYDKSKYKAQFRANNRQDKMRMK